MMKLTIVPADTMVYVDNEPAYNIDLSYVPTNVHAFQWKTNIGWIEYVDNDDGTKPGNQVITELPDWANRAFTDWGTKKAEEQAEFAAKIAAAQNSQPTTTGTQTL
jgi:hypothetical protein